MELVKYAPPGRVALDFHRSDAFVRGLMGPVGSGKSSSCCVEIMMRSVKQRPWARVRRARWLIIRNSYPELTSTTIKTWQNWFPESIAPFKWDAPIQCNVNIPNLGDGTSLELEVLFMALDRPTETGKLRSLELTGGWINEASEIPREIFDMLTQRVGRYPPKAKGGPTWSGVILDTNPPDDDHWWYDLAENVKPKSYEFFRQPGGLILRDGQYSPNPLAENVMNLPNGYEYYQRQLAGKTDGWVNVFLLGNYGTTMDGKPVYPEWNDSIHSAKEEIKPMPGMPIFLGWDFGLTPACIIAQQTPKGQLVILDELVSEDMGIRQFSHDIVKPHLLNKYPMHTIMSWGDPAGSVRVQTDERTCFQELAEAGIYTEPANTNDFLSRREAVAYYLTKMADGQPAFLLNQSVDKLRRGFNGRYKFERLRTSGPARYKDRPVKDDYSHPHDALQYLCLMVRAGATPTRARQIVQKSVKGWI